MTQIIFITIFAVLLAILLSRKGRESVLRPAKDKFVGICSFALGQGAKKQERKEKILEILSSGGSVSNSDIREALGVSGRSVRRYMSELEREGKVEQLGKVGRSVVYKLK